MLTIRSTDSSSLYTAIRDARIVIGESSPTTAFHNMNREEESVLCLIEREFAIKVID